MVILKGNDVARVETCVYPGARLRCRGPARMVDGPFVALLGGTETHAPMLRRTASEVVEDRSGIACLNLAVEHAGPDAYLADPGLLVRAKGAAAVVVTMPGAPFLRNPYYTVHRYRNDRVIGQSDKLKALFPELDFLSYAFVGHMLGEMAAVSPGRFTVVRQTLQRTWVERMTALVSQFDCPVVALWLEDSVGGNRLRDGAAKFVTEDMCRALPVNCLIKATETMKGGEWSAAETHEAAGVAIAEILKELDIATEQIARREAG